MKRSKTLWISISVIVAIALIGTGAWWGVRTHQANQLAQAKEQCAEASDQLRIATNKYNTYHDTEAATAYDITDKQVEDANVITTLASVYEEESPAVVACNTNNVNELETRIATMQTNAAWYDTHFISLKEATSAVTEAKDAKTLKDAQEALEKKLTEAKKLYESSKGKVADDKTRSNLKTAIDEASKLTESSDIKAISKQSKTLSEHVTNVNDSVKKKTEADKKKAEEEAKKKAEAEAEAARQAQAAQTQQQYVAPQTTYTPTTTYTAPQTTYTAPQQTQITTNNNSNTSVGPGGVIFNPNSGGLGCSNDGSNCANSTYDGWNHNGY